MAKKNYQEFDHLPAWNHPQWDGDTLVNKDAPRKWSGTSSPPAIGTRIETRNVGPGTVVKYFEEYGWLGLLMKVEDPPKWWIKQNPDNPPAHIFGIDID